MSDPTEGPRAPGTLDWTAAALAVAAIPTALFAVAATLPQGGRLLGGHFADPARRGEMVSLAWLAWLLMTYILTPRDKTLSPEAQRRMAEAAGCQAILVLDGGPMPMFSRPAEFAQR